MMCDCKNPKLICGDLIDAAVSEPTEDLSSASATKYRAEEWIDQNEIGRSLALSHKREAKLNICFL